MIRTLTSLHRNQIVSARESSSENGRKAMNDLYDACVIGSGPGGAVAAATLALEGKKVLLIERGPFVAPEKVNFRVLDMSNKFGHVETTSGYRTVLYQGSALGGSSMIFGAVAMKPQPFTFDDWSERSGVSSINVETLEPHYRHVAEIMSVTRQTKELENRPNAIVREMAVALGKEDDLVLVNRYTSGCAGVGLCNFGCGMDLKGNMINSFLPLALETGNLTVLTDCEAEAIVGQQSQSGWQARAVVVSTKGATGGKSAKTLIRTRTVVVAGGAFFSSAILLRSPGLPNRHLIGSKIYLQPHAQIFALFDEPVTKRGVFEKGQYVPNNGVPAIYNFLGFLRDQHFWWLASILYPASLASFISSLRPDEHFDIMKRFHHTMSVTVTVKDDPAKSRIVVKDGRAQLSFEESQQDIESFRHCFRAAAEGFLAVGARRVFLPLLRPPTIQSQADLKKIDSLDFTYNDLILYSDHTSGGNQFGADIRRGVTDERGRVFGTTNVFVSDSSLFPAAPGVNPSWTIMALTRHVAMGMLNGS
ncbi:MAG TPA: GMC family oxidoreductase [Pyrinomonadaceae bacterium]